MNLKKTKEKERRRARKLADQAWEAANEQNLDLAEKIIRRAVETQVDNPVLWNDQGMLLALRGKEMEAEDAFRSAISLAPDYAEPFAHLGALCAKQGCWRDAVRLLERAVQHAPQSALYAERLQAYRVLAETRIEPPLAVSPTALPVETVPVECPVPTVTLDWDAIGQQLTMEGCVRITGLLPADACAALRDMFDVDALFAKTVVMDREDFGRGTYRYFQAPVPPLIAGLRRSVYPHVARIANHWQAMLHQADRFPEAWEEFRQRCQAAGQTTPTPILLKYGPHGFNALHRDLRGAVYFPIQMAVVLSPRLEEVNQGAGFGGGEFLFCDVPVSKKSRRREIPAGQGDALLFCTRDRLVRIGGAWGLQPVKHGVKPITVGLRMVLGLPFHEYR